MLWTKRPDPIEIVALKKALAASRAGREAMARQLGERASEAIVHCGAIGRLEEELIDERAVVAELRLRCEASELLARKIGEARDQLVGERDHAQHKVEALLAIADTFYGAAVAISHEPEPGDDTADDGPEGTPMKPCPGWPECKNTGCKHRKEGHAKTPLCDSKCASLRVNGGLPPCTPVPVPAAGEEKPT